MPQSTALAADVSAGLGAQIAAGKLKPDPDQEGIARRLDRLAVELAQAEGAGAGWGARLFGKKPAEPPRGVYLWADVATDGVSALMGDAVRARREMEETARTERGMARAAQ